MCTEELRRIGTFIENNAFGKNCCGVRREKGLEAEKRRKSRKIRGKTKKKKWNHFRSKTNCHSLWLIPKEPARSNIQKVIDHHSSEQKTANFRAHVTLIAGLEPEGGEAEVIAKAESLALKLGPISARVERTACMDLYFKSVFALLERDPALLDAHKVAREAFGQDPSDGSDFMPHASLLYGDLPMSTREAIRQEAGVGLVDPGITLEFESIQVWSTKGVVPEWKPLATLPIG